MHLLKAKRWRFDECCTYLPVCIRRGTIHLVRRRSYEYRTLRTATFSVCLLSATFISVFHAIVERVGSTTKNAQMQLQRAAVCVRPPRSLQFYLWPHLLSLHFPYYVEYQYSYAQERFDSVTLRRYCEYLLQTCVHGNGNSNDCIH